MNADGSGLVRLTRRPGFDGEAVWSPDGKRIAFAHHRSSGPDQPSEEDGIYVIDVDTSGLFRVTEERDSSPSWSPAGTRLAFLNPPGARDYGASGIFIVDVDGSGLSRVTYQSSTDTADFQPAWAPDGSSIAFARGIPQEGLDLRLVRPDGRGDTPLTGDYHNDEFHDEGPVWSPDSRRVAFSRTRAAR